MIFAEFERQYRKIYGLDSGRSDEYVTVKSEIVALINKYIDEQSGKKRKYAKQLGKYVENRDSSFEAKMKNALIDNTETLSVFIQLRYNGTNADVIDGISSRMGEVRNGIAHSRLDLKFDAVHLHDIHIVEELIYAMRLKKISLTNEKCKKAINKLFNEKVAL